MVRARRVIGVCFAVLNLLSSSSFAQSVGASAFDLERLVLNPGGREGLVVGGGDTLAPQSIRFSLLLHYEDSPLVLRKDGVRLTSLVDGRFSAHLTMAYGVAKWLELGAQLPVVLWQGGGENLAALNLPAPTAAALGAPWLQARISAVRERDGMPFDLSIDLLGNIPIAGVGTWAGDGTPSFLPRLGLGKTFGDVVRVAFEGGAWFRAPTTNSGLLAPHLAPSVQLGLAASTVGASTRFELSGRTAIPTNGQPVGGELLLGLRHPVGPVELFALGGPGFGELPGTPLFRVLIGVAFPSGERRPDACAQGKPHGPAECPDLDDDNDGILNGADSCPLLPGVASAKGCPDGDGDGVKDADDQCAGMAGPASNSGCPDRDQDGVRDDRDQCPNEKGPAENNGCPRKDSDGDGLLDQADKCPGEKGPAGNDGCPWPDTDKDGVADKDDRCPALAGPAPLGCPTADGDKDATPDYKDKCPTEPGAPELDGCPKNASVKLEGDRLVIREKIFFDTSRATIQKRSFELLKKVAGALKAHGEVSRIYIDGHTDAQGARESNLKLSQARAESVKAFLVKEGVGAGRLEPRGFGPDKPIADNKTAAGREQNRRVEFLFETATQTREIK